MVLDPSMFVDSPKPKLVILLLDISGSMSGDKIATLNSAVETMITSFKKVVSEKVVIQLAVITFESSASLYLPLQSVENISWQGLRAGGEKNLADALIMAKRMIEDRTVVPSRAYRPVVVLVSDGFPVDGWDQPMGDFVGSGRSQKCDRLAMLTGDNSAASVMEQFLEGSGNRLFFANDANDISVFFHSATKYVMSVGWGIWRPIISGKPDEPDASEKVVLPPYPGMPDWQTTITAEGEDLDEDLDDE